MTELRVIQKRPHRDQCWALDRRDTPWCLNYPRPRISADRAGGGRGHTTSWLLVRCLDPACEALALIEEFGLWLLLGQALNGHPGDAVADGRQRWALTPVPDRQQQGMGYQRWEVGADTVFYEYETGETSIVMSHTATGEAQLCYPKDPRALGAALAAADLEQRSHRRWNLELEEGRL
ncbi:hypothetical protein B5566_02605 [Mycobacterium sp. MHSD3]|nr:hypothetical protein B5566_02605 [Mycobacterium sp. MHSD3]